MLLKLIGGIFIITACGLFGIAASNKYRGRPRELRNLRSSLQMLETEIIYGATPLPNAFNNIADKSCKVWYDFFKLASINLNSGIYYSVKEAWDSAIEEKLKNTNLNKPDIELLGQFGNILGNSDCEDQLKHFKLFYKQLEQQEDAAVEDKKKNEKLYRSLGFLLGLAVFIILV